MRALIIGLLLLASPAAAQGTGNLPPDFYPAPKCEKPQAPGRPPESGNNAAMQAYNGKVKQFNAAAVAFNACMKDYVGRAQADIAVIQARVHDAVAAANAR